ncbi:MAG: prefoldin subunit alpha [Aigarchaeota archaeon]|nr:prefoldin subunit alpha [Aigarchaeota archaeon]MCX8193459.1 prefoldin subunit alpha [Nitrososphaeria archaeon]MDW7985809.1 prefoldin subunit alpha [Nitrososphaerota archaeon]
MSSLEEQLNRAVAELQLLEQLINETRTRLSTLQALAVEYEGALSFLEELSKNTSTMKILVPIGGGNYIHAEVVDGQKVEVSVGAGVIVTKTIQEGKEMIEKRKANIIQLIQSYEQRLEQFLRRENELRSIIGALSAQIREKEARGIRG